MAEKWGLLKGQFSLKIIYLNIFILSHCTWIKLLTLLFSVKFILSADLFQCTFNSVNSTNLFPLKNKRFTFIGENGVFLIRPPKLKLNLTSGFVNPSPNYFHVLCKSEVEFLNMLWLIILPHTIKKRVHFINEFPICFPRAFTYSAESLRSI